MKNNKKGFTLTEVLVTVAIIAVLFAVAVPSTAAIRKNLEMRRLDDSARAIYTVVQNNLTAMKSAGTTGDDTVFPVDLATGECTLLKGTSGMDALLPTGSIEGEIAGHDYVAIFNPETGVVYDVYYSEQVSLTADAPTIYGDAALRKADRVGFYSGGGGNDITYTQLPQITTTITNAEELAFSVTVSDTIPDGTTLTITITDESGHSYTYYDAPANGFSFGTDIVMDSLAGPQFKDFVSGYGLIPGEDITVKAVLTKPAVGNDVFRKSVSHATANSLFDSVDGSTAHISSLRHLQNLDKDFSNITNGITAAEQTADIDCSGAGGTYVFTPIYNTSLTGYNGKDNELQNLNIAGEGLFKSMSGASDTNRAKLENIRIFNPTVAGSGTSVGVLAGYTKYTNINNCQVFTDKSNLSGTVTAGAGTTNLGGLIGKAESCTVSKSSASLPSLAGNDYVGGLIGAQVGGSILNSYANIGVYGTDDWNNSYGMTATGTAGGLVGSGSGAISGCYTGGYIKSAAVSGGIVGNRSGGTLKNSYSVATLKGTTKGGIVGTGTKTAAADGNVFLKSGFSGASGSEAKSASQIEDLTGSWATDDPATFGYHLDGAYPYPMITGLVHYGDWPSEKVTDIGAFTESGCGMSKRVKYLMIPSGTAKTFYISAISESTLAPVACELKNTPGVSYTLTPPSAGSTISTLTIPKTAAPGMYGFVFEAGGTTACIVAVVYDMVLKLTPSDTTGVTPRDNSSYVRTSGVPKKTYGHVTFDSNHNSGTVTVTLSVPSPTKTTIESTYDTLKAAYPGAKFSVTKDAIQSDYANIGKDSIKLSAPDNYKFNTSSNIFNTPDSTPVSSGYEFQIKGGTVAGRARLHAEWVKDKNVSIDSVVMVKGSRALIHSVKAVGSSLGDCVLGMPTYNSSEYPYLVTLDAAIGQDVTLTITPELFRETKQPGGTMTYEWKVNDVTMKTDSDYASAWDSGNHSFTYTIKAGSSATATYTVSLKYKYVNGSAIEESTDTMLVTVNYRAARNSKNYEKVLLKNIDYKGNWNNVGTDSVFVEQRDFPGTEYAGCNVNEVVGYVNGALDTQLRWYVCTKGAMGDTCETDSTVWTPINGTRGSITVYDGKTPKATVEWNPDRSQLNNSFTGGSVVVTGLDNDYDGTKDFVFLLKAVAVDAVDGNADLSYKVIKVHVKPILSFPRNILSSVATFGEADRNFTPNRTDCKWDYNWSSMYIPIDDTQFYARSSILTSGGLSTKVTAQQKYGSLTSSSPVLNIRHQGDWAIGLYREPAGDTTVTLQYGPYEAQCIYQTKSLSDNAEAVINWDIDLGKDKDHPKFHFFVEKDAERSLNLSWVTTLPRYIAKTSNSENSTKNNYAQPLKGSKYLEMNVDGYTNAWVNVGEVDYTLRGLDYTRGDPISVTFGFANDPLAWNTINHTFYFYVYGMDIRENNASGSIVNDTGIQMSAIGETDTLYADYFFPNKDNKIIKSQSVAWSVIDPDLVELSATTGNTVTLTSKQQSFSTIVTCIYTVETTNGKTFKVVRNIPVTDDTTDDIDVTISAATAQEAASAFGTVGKWVNQKDSSGNWLLVEDSSFGANVMYLKLSPVSGSLANFPCDIHYDSGYLDIQQKALGNDRILRIAARPGAGTEQPQLLDLVFEVGTATTKTETIKYYSAPILQIFNASGQDITNSSLPIPYATASADGYTGSYGYYATLTPQLNNPDVTSINWTLSCPTGYNVNEYVALTSTKTAIGSTGTTGIDILFSEIYGKMIPDFRVFINAQSANAAPGSSAASAGYALVFLPETGD